MSIKQFEQELAAGLPAPVYLFSSSEGFLLYEVLSAVRERYAADSGFNFDVYDSKSPDDDVPMEHIVDTLNTLPFLAERRAVVLKNAQKLAKKEVKKLEEYLADPSPASLLVLLHEGAAPKLFDAAALKKVKAIALAVPEREIPMWVAAQAKRKGMKLTGEAIEYLVSIVGTDLGLLAAELEKLSCLGAASTITLNDIKGMFYAGAEYSAFDLIDALKRREVREAFRIFEQVSRDQDPQMLLGALNYHFSRQFGGGYGSGKGAGNDGGVFRLLHEADIALKTSHRYVIEELLVTLLRR